MQNKIDVFTNFVDASLVQIVYTKVDKSSKGFDETYLEDKYEVVSCSAEKLIINYERGVNVPCNKDIYNLKVIAKVVRDAKDNIDLSKVVNEEFIVNNIDDILCIAFNFVSSLISNITGAFGSIPIVTPPALLKQAKKKTERKK